MASPRKLFRPAKITSEGSAQARLERELQASCVDMLLPLAGILLRAGIGAGEFLELFRRAYVLTAADQLSSVRRKPNVSRIAVATGLTRQEVTRLLNGGKPWLRRNLRQLQRANRVLAGWHTDKRYTKDRAPKSIRVDGTGPTFHRLVRDYGGDVPPRAVLDELRRASAIETLSDGTIVPTRRFVEYGPRSQKAVKDISTKLRRLAETLKHNLDSPAATLFEDVAVCKRLREDHFPIAARRLSFSAERFLSAMRMYLSREQRQETSKNGRAGARTLGIGVFLFTNPKRKQ